LEADYTEWIRALAGGGEAAERAARAIGARPEWRSGPPPRELLNWLLAPPCDSDSRVFGLARGWERAPMCRALLAEFVDTIDEQSKTHIAWLLKEFPAPEEWERLAAIAGSPQAPPQARSHLIQALQQLVFGRFIGWHELGPLAEQLRGDPAPAIREAVAGLVGSLPASESGMKLLSELLYDRDAAVIGVAAWALANHREMNEFVPRQRVKELLQHSSLNVRMLAERLLASLDSEDG